MIKNSILYPFGASMSLVGVPLGMYLNQMVGNIRWSPVTMVLSVVMLMNWKIFGSGLPRLFRTKFGIMVLFQIIMLFYGLMSQGYMTSQYMSFHIYIIALCYAFSTHRNTEFVDNIPKACFYLSLVTSILGAYFCSIGMVAGEDVYEMRLYDSSYVLEQFTVSAGALVNFFAALTFTKKNMFERVLFAVAIMLDIYILFSCTKRTPVFVALAGTVLYLYKQGALNRHYFFKYSSYIILAIVVFICAYIRYKSFQENVDDIFTRLYDGIRILLGYDRMDYVEDSAQSRVVLRKWAYNYISLNFGFFSYLFGAGYLTKWLDAPILEAFLDMGLLGFCFYAYLLGWIPLNTLFMKTKDNVILFALMYSLHMSLSMFNSGNPYQYIKYTGVVLLIFVLYAKQKRIVNCNGQ